MVFHGLGGETGLRMCASDAIIEILLENGIDTIFGYPGGAILPFYDSLYRQRGRIKHIRTAHEQGAVFAADGYARATGIAGVCVSTSGPGATNLITGIASAYMDSVPMVAITGQAPSALLGRDSFQEIDITSMTLAVTKHSYSIRDASKLVETVREAFEIAVSGRPGPVHIDIPRDILLAEVDYSPKIKAGIESRTTFGAERKLIEMAVLEMESSARPVIYAGGGVARSGAFSELLEFAQKTDIPVVSTLMGISSFPSEHRLSLGLCGMHGHSCANRAIAKSDLIIAVGARFSDRSVSKEDASGKSVIQIDIDETEMGKNVHSTLSIRGDIKNVVRMLSDMSKDNCRKEWMDEIEKEKEEQESHSDIGFNAKGIISRINKRFKGATVATDVGQHQMWTVQYWSFEGKGELMTSGGLGAMGYGLGAAIGAKMALKKGVVLITGDGSFKMNLNELATIKSYGIPVTIVVLNNKALGMVRQLQKVFTQQRYSEVDCEDNTDFCTVARGFGIDSYRACSYQELEDVISNLNMSASTVIECMIEKDMNVVPMVKPGGRIVEMMYL